MASIIYKPTCSNCGAVIKEPVYGLQTERFIGFNIMSTINYSQNPYMELMDSHVNPARCPECGAGFTQIEMPNKIDVRYETEG